MEMGDFGFVQDTGFGFEGAAGIKLDGPGADQSADRSAGSHVEPAIDDDISRGLAVDGHGPRSEAFQEDDIGFFAQGETAAVHYTAFRGADFVNEIPFPLARRGRGVFDPFHFPQTGRTGWN